MPDEQIVSEPEGNGAQPDPSKVTPPATTPETPPVVPEKPKAGYDELPEHAKEIISRQSEKARREKERADTLERELNALKQPKTPADKYSDLPAEEREQVEMFEKLAKKAGYKSAAEIEGYVQERLQQEQTQKEIEAQEEADRRELQDVLKEFDGTSMPKITEEEMLRYLEEASKDPRRSFLLKAPFREIATYMKSEEIRRIEVDKLLKAGGEIPPEIAKSGGTTKQPQKTTPRANSFAELRKIIGGIG